MKDNTTLIVGNTKTKKLSLLHVNCTGRMDFIEALNKGVKEEGKDPMEHQLIGIVDGIYTWETKQ